MFTDPLSQIKLNVLSTVLLSGFQSSQELASTVYITVYQTEQISKGLVHNIFF